MKRFWNVMGCIGASLFSIVLVILAISFPLYRSVISFAQPKTLTKVIQNIDYQALLPSAEELQESLGADWIEPEVIETIMKSDAMGRIVELYSTDMLNTALQTGEKAQLTADALKEIVDEEMDSLVESILPYIPEDVELSEEQLIEEIKTVVSENTDQILELLPTLEETTDTEQPAARSRAAVSEEDDGDVYMEEEVGDDMVELLTAIRTLLAPQITVTFIGLLVFFALLIFFCRFNHTFSGLLWLGVDSAIVSLFVALLAFASGNLPVSFLPEEVAPIVRPMVTILTEKLTVSAIVYFAVAILLIAGYIVIRRARKAKLVLPTEAVAEPIAEPVTE